MKDSYGRSIDYMRISVTELCNLRCVHCMPSGGPPPARERCMSLEQTIAVAKEAARLGVRRIRLTGGEPLMRKDLSLLIAQLRGIEGIEEVHLTTNGVLLAARLPELLEAGLSGVNISMNGTDAAGFRDFCGADLYGKAEEGLRAALAAEGLRVKVNCVPTEGREEDCVRLAETARTTAASVRYIELMPMGPGASLRGVDSASMLARLEEEYGPSSPLSGEGLSGPAQYRSFEGFKSPVGFISAMTHRFCKDCNRIRLTCDGRLKGCLAFPAGFEVFEASERGDGPAIRRALEGCIAAKPAGHAFESGAAEEDRCMSQIGG